MILRALLTLAWLVVPCTPAPALQIEIRYTHDTRGFFNNPQARAAMEAVADFYETILHDSLARIDRTEWPAGNTWTATTNHPGTGGTLSLPNLVVPADTLVVYAGGRALGGPAGIGGAGGYELSGNSQAWFDRVSYRGQAGAAANPPRDFGPWGGSLVFDTGRTWNFSLTDRGAGGLPFVSIALHEFAHLLGIGTAPSWDVRRSGSNFTGPFAMASYGGPVPLDPTTGYGHWRNNTCGSEGYNPSDPNNVLSRSAGSFGTPHGTTQVALLDPQLCNNGPFHIVMTDLDLAALRDIGWQVVPPTSLRSTGDPLALSWPGTTGVSYRLERSTTLAAGSWSTVTTLSGNGGVLTYPLPSPRPARAFFRLADPLPGPAMLAAPETLLPAPMSRAPADVGGCHCGSH